MKILILNIALCPKSIFLTNSENSILLRLLKTYQFNKFSQQQIDIFLKQTYTISNDSDRSGYRLIGAPVYPNKQKMISEGISYGSVEITGDGMPIILLKDAPTIGGYFKIGTVFSLDLAKLAQKKANTEVKFKLMDIEEAQKKRIQFNNFFNIKL